MTAESTIDIRQSTFALTPVRAWDWLANWRCALMAVLLLAAVVRLANLDHNSLTHAEAARVNAAWSTTWNNARWFPPAQYALLWIVRHATSGSEFAMRLPSVLAGVACVGAVFLLTRRYFGPWAGVCAAALTGVHAELVEHSRIVKEFSMETLVSTLIFWAGVEACRSRSARALKWFTMAAMAGACLTYTWSLIVAGWIPVIAWAYWGGAKDQESHVSSPGLGVGGPRRLKPLLRCGAVIAVVFALWYLWFFDCHNRQGAGHDYGVIRGAWPQSYQCGVLARWFVDQSYAVLQFVLGIGDLYSPINWLIGGYLILLGAAAWREVRRQAPALLVALVSVILVTALAGAIRAWPYGRFHTVIFLVPPTCVVCGVGLKVLIERIRLPLPVLALIAVCVLNPAARAVKNTAVYPNE